MSITTRIVTEDVVFPWDGVTVRLAKGQVLAVAAGGALERAIGLHRLIPHGLPASTPPAAVQPLSAPVEALTVETAAPQEDKPLAAPVKARPAKSTATAAKDEVTHGR